MNIFFIPSKYPSKQEPLAGIFFYEQAQALGEQKDQIIINSLWGQNDCALAINKPFLALYNLINFFKKKNYLKKISTNNYEIFNPTFSWFHKIFGGNIAKVIKANEDNFLKAQSKFGSIDLIHAHLSYPAGYIAMKLAQKFKVPYIITEHMGNFPYAFYLENGDLPQIIRESLEKADQIIAVSESLSHQIKKYGIKNEIKVIPNLVDEDYFYPVKSKNNSVFTFFNLGNDGLPKGTQDLVKAISIAVKKNPNLIFKIAGTGNYSSYKKFAKKLGIENFIIWLGPLNRKQVRDEFRDCDAFILPSHYESFGVVYIEAMACGKPVIATRCGGPESIVTSETGILVEVGNIRQISQAILDMANNLHRFEPKKIRQIFLNNFSKKAVTKRIIGCYKNLHQ